ncbi:MAG: glycosyltransferase [Thermoplasmata archaeon]
MDLGSVLIAVLLIGGILAVLAQGVAVVLAVRMPHLSPPTGPVPSRGPKVSVIVAARNEEADLSKCLDDLVAQDYPDLEIIVVDGGSTDRTREVALARAPRVRVLEEPTLPPGWVGKNWGCDVGYRAASGDFLLFTDADVRYHPGAVRATVAWAETEGAPLTTLAPRVEMVGFWEKVVLPFYVQMVLTYFRTPRVNRDGSSAAMANGQYTLVRRAEYEAVGGHAAVRGTILEDVALARRFRAAGLRMRVAWAPDLLVTRMYRDRHEMFEGLVKNIHDTEFSAARQVGLFLAVLSVFLAPLALLPIGLALGSVALTVEGGIVAFVIVAKHVLLARGLRAPPAFGLLFPIAAGYYLVLLATSLCRGLLGRPVSWKGRSYPIRREGRAPPRNG